MLTVAISRCVRRESAIDGQDLHEAPHEQAGADEQHQRQRDFGADEDVAQAIVRAIADRAALSLAQCRHEMCERRLERRHEAR